MHLSLFLFFNLTFTELLFFLLTIASIVCIAYIVLKNMKLVQMSRRSYIKQNESINLERKRISSELHDELGSGLSAIKLYAELASRSRPDIAEIKQLSEMVNEISTKIHDIVWSTDVENDQLDNVIYHIQLQIGNLFKHSNFSFESNLPEHIPSWNIKHESRRDFYLLAKEIAHNALKHSKGDKLILNFSINEEFVTLTIKDNGIGFDPNETRSNGMGLSNINDRLARLRAELTMENYKGTKVVVKIPIWANFENLPQKEKSGYFSFLRKH